MKKVLILPLLFLFVAGQAQELSEKNLAKAKKNADLEIKNLPPKGWECNRNDLNFESMMQEAWKLKFSMYDSQTPYYIYTFGNGSGKTAKEAYDQAASKAKDQLPALSLMYFSMWNMAADIPEEDKNKISSAINEAEKQIGSKLSEWDLEPFVNMIREKRGKQEVHLRYYYPQMKVRDICRAVIMAELKKTTDWSKEKMIKYLTYEK